MLDRAATIREFTKPLVRTKLHTALIKEFGSIPKAAKALHFTPKVIYDWIKKDKVSDKGVDMCKLLSYNPVNFTKI